MNIERFGGDLTLFKHIHMRLDAPYPVDALNVFDKQLEAVTKRTRKAVEELTEQLRTEWPRSPLLFNGLLFRPLGIESKEVPLTRGLAWWLGCGQPDSELARLSLAATLRLTLKLTKIAKEDLATWCVSAEDIPGGDRHNGRIDIFLHGKIRDVQHCIAIEAKVGAAEGVGQLAKYVKALTKHHPKAQQHVVFLTRSGDMARSMGKLRKVKAQALTYEALLTELLPVFQKFDSESEHASEFGRLFLADIARLCEVHIGSRLGDTDVFQLERLLNAQLKLGGSTHE